jgi:hypothetical protein
VAITRYGLVSHLVLIHSLSKKKSYNPGVAVTTPVWALPNSLATTIGITVVFSSWGYLDVSVLPVRFSLCEITKLHLVGLPHSEISGSMHMCCSPKLIAAYHVLLRLQDPRHPPYALM